MNWFVKSVQCQTFKDFEFIVADGGSDNYEELCDYFDNLNGDVKMRMVQHKIGDTFRRALLNNVGVRNANAEYVMTTDVDMVFAPKFMETLMSHVRVDRLIESRTMYWKSGLVQRIFNGALNPLEDIEACKKGRIKKRTTAGGCQCLHMDGWNKIRGFDETYIGWGSQDQDMLKRAGMAGLKVVWMGETVESLQLFHMPHPKLDIKKDLADQHENKKRLAHIQSATVNPDGWGGIKE